MRYFILFFLLLWSLSSYSKDEPKPIRFSHVVKRETPKGIGAQMFKRLANNDEQLKRYVRIEVYPEGVLYEDEQIINALLDNKVQLAAPSLSVLCNKEKSKFCKFDKFYEFKDVTAVDTFQKSSEGQRLLTEVTSNICNKDKTNCLTGLFYWHNGMKQLSFSPKKNVFAISKKECPEDKFYFMKEKLTFRIQNSKVIKDEFEKAFTGARTEVVPFRKVKEYLRKNTKINGQENTWSNIWAEKYNEVQKCFIETNHAYLGYLVLTNQKFWNGLDQSVQEGLKKILAKVTNKVNETASQYEESGRENIKKELEKELKGKIESLSKEELEKYISGEK